MKKVTHLRLERKIWEKWAWEKEISNVIFGGGAMVKVISGRLSAVVQTRLDRITLEFLDLNVLFGMNMLNIGMNMLNMDMNLLNVICRAKSM